MYSVSSLARVSRGGFLRGYRPSLGTFRPDLHTYLARHPNDGDNNQLRGGAFAVEFTGDVLAEVGNVNSKQQKYDATGWRRPGSTLKIFTYGGLIERLTREVLAKPPPQTVEESSAEVLQRCTVLDTPLPQQ